MNPQSHWQTVYERKTPEEQTWHQARPDISLEWVEKVIDETPARLADVGGGASTLVDHLLARGGVEVTVIDIAQSALEAVKERLGEQAEQVDWVVADLSEPIDCDPPLDIWHDRAVFHFLTDKNDRQTYLDNLDRNLAADGHAIIATFAPEGPEKCSGLPVQRYSPQSLADTLGDAWQLVDSRPELHATPWGGEQAFVYALFCRSNSPD